MSKKSIIQTIPPDDEILASKIYVIRKQKVMLDRDLAHLYGVETKVLKQSVRRNMDRFPEEFIFNLLFFKGKMDSYGIYV
ncbi:ORF6N domain-containing protein [Sphingobacterium yanglingense]|uniref:ORF6N domain-containing protein n=1 Tax=Sphingobacterium yanglingense TaxID=1437280 RepID=UPI001FE9EDBD|nr:ORF6N domain-containing protein [Sphingobacterium yanglingense]